MFYDEAKVMEEMEKEWAWIYQVEDRHREKEFLSDSQIFILALLVEIANVGETNSPIRSSPRQHFLFSDFPHKVHYLAFPNS